MELLPRGARTLPPPPLLLLLLLLLGLSRPVGAGDGRRVCQGTSNLLTLLGTREYHYKSMVRMYSNCSVVLENLEITYTLENQDLSFLESIQEVGGYVLIAMNDVATVPLVNLRLIRGQNLYDKFALLVMSNYHSNNVTGAPRYTSGLRQLQLSHLTEILNGGVKVTNNPLLCNMEKIQWWDIVDKASSFSVLLKFDDYKRDCEECDPGCVNGSCWAAGPDHCQKFTKLVCAEQCGTGRCRGPKPIDCCNQHCAAGCTGPLATDCLACKNFSDDGTCKDSCPPLNIYNRKSQQVVENPNAKYTFGATCVKACPRNYVVTEGSCVRACSPNTYEVEENGVQRCKRCEGPCPKACDGIGVGGLTNTIAVNSSNIESFRNCTKVNGDIIFLKSSFSGDQHYNIPPMDPKKLEYFRTVKEITGYLLIQTWPVNMTSLSVFENLEIIRGRSLFMNKYSFVVVSAGDLRWLGLRSLKELSAGDVRLKDNNLLCHSKAMNWSYLFRDKTQKVDQTPPLDVCEGQNQTCDQQCSSKGCWGPGSNMCLTCQYFKRKQHCVERCNLLQGEPREVEVEGSCVECHPECLVKTGTQTCHGPGPDQCSQCAHFKDGSHCVRRCPHEVLDDESMPIWKYADQNGQCQLCHQNCSEGCSGPGLSGCSR